MNEKERTLERVAEYNYVLLNVLLDCTSKSGHNDCFAVT